MAVTRERRVLRDDINDSNLQTIGADIGAIIRKLQGLRDSLDAVKDNGEPALATMTRARLVKDEIADASGVFDKIKDMILVKPSER